MRSQRAVMLVWTAMSVALSLRLAAQVADTPTSQALRFFTTLDPADSSSTLRAIRPPAPTAHERAKVLATLPEQGELKPTPKEVVKISTLDPILAFHDRRGGYEIKVIDTPQIVVGLHERVVLLLSRKALGTLSALELQAMAAHEIGHEYFWPDFKRIEGDHDTQGRQVLELKCDGIAGLTLVALGLDVSPLHSGIRKMASFNERIGATAGAGGYPSLRERRAFMQALLTGVGRFRAQISNR